MANHADGHSHTLRHRRCNAQGSVLEVYQDDVSASPDGKSLARPSQADVHQWKACYSCTQCEPELAELGANPPVAGTQQAVRITPGVAMEVDSSLKQPLQAMKPFKGLAANNLGQHNDKLCCEMHIITASMPMSTDAQIASIQRICRCQHFKFAKHGTVAGIVEP